jgi:glycosyltransferase involved in cell wall biosynthesis
MTQHVRPLISTIVPVYNGGLYLARALESVLNQGYRPIELIVVDDGSVDDSADVARAYGGRIRYHYQPNRGAGAARNAGVDLAMGEYFAFLDADDLWTENKLERQMDALDADGSADMVFGHVRQFVSWDVTDAVRRRLKCPPGEMPGRVPATMLVRRDAFRRVGYFSSRVGEAVEWMLRALDLGLTSIMLPDVVLRRRLHAGNSARLSRGVVREYAAVLKQTLDRRRGTGSASGGSKAPADGAGCA